MVSNASRCDSVDCVSLDTICLSDAQKSYLQIEFINFMYPGKDFAYISAILHSI